MTSKDYIKNIVINGTPEEKKALYGFNKEDTKEKILKKFKLFARGNYPRYFKGKSAPFHDEMMMGYIGSYSGDNFMNIAFRGSAKTTILKLFVTFILLNDEDKRKNYIKILTKDGKNSKQIVTDIYNLMVEVRDIYGDVFEREGDIKREETMGSFTMKSGVKLASGTVGQTQRGHVQDAYRPDWIWFDDVEDRDSVRSLVITEGIISKSQEAIDGLAKEGSIVITANYISEEGVVQWFKDKPSIKTLITPILKDDLPTWDYFTLEDIQKIRDDADDFYGEYMCDPQRGEDKFFDTDMVERDLAEAKDPIETITGVKYWAKYQPHHRYGIGADTSEGIGRDSNTLSLFDFKTGEIIATYRNNRIAPDLFGHELMRVGREFGNCIVAPERNNTGFATITAMKEYPNLYRERSLARVTSGISDKYGWHTNQKSKPTMFFEFRKDYNDGLIKIYDKDLLAEMKSYTNSDLQDSKLSSVTRHFDLLTSAVIGWQMKNHSDPTVDRQQQMQNLLMRERNIKNKAR